MLSLCAVFGVPTMSCLVSSCVDTPQQVAIAAAATQHRRSGTALVAAAFTASAAGKLSASMIAQLHELLGANMKAMTDAAAADRQRLTAELQQTAQLQQQNDHINLLLKQAEAAADERAGGANKADF